MSAVVGHATTRSVKFPAGSTWYQAINGKSYAGGSTATVTIGLDDVPLFFRGAGPIQSTAGALDDEFFHLLRGGACPHLEIETYTFDVLPPDVHPGDIVKSISQEYAWVMGKLGLEGQK